MAREVMRGPAVIEENEFGPVLKIKPVGAQKWPTSVYFGKGFKGVAPEVGTELDTAYYVTVVERGDKKVRYLDAIGEKPDGWDAGESRGGSDGACGGSSDELIRAVLVSGAAAFLGSNPNMGLDDIAEMARSLAGVAKVEWSA